MINNQSNLWLCTRRKEKEENGAAAAEGGRRGRNYHQRQKLNKPKVFSSAQKGEGKKRKSGWNFLGSFDQCSALSIMLKLSVKESLRPLLTGPKVL